MITSVFIFYLRAQYVVDTQEIVLRKLVNAIRLLFYKSGQQPSPKKVGKTKIRQVESPRAQLDIKLPVNLYPGKTIEFFFSC